MKEIDDLAEVQLFYTSSYPSSEEISLSGLRVYNICGVAVFSVEAEMA